MAARVEITIDCRDLARTSAFWTALLGYAPAEPMDDRYWAAIDPRGHEPRLVFQLVDDAPPSGKSAVHLDVHVDDLDSFARSVVDLGGRRVDETAIAEAGSTWVRCADPEGNIFCLVLQR